MERAIVIINQQPEQATQPIHHSMLGASQGNMGSQPVLNQWIKESLSFLRYDSLLALAFSTGHWQEFRESQAEYPNNRDMQRVGFFQRYFAREGSSRGVQMLWELVDVNLFYPKERGDFIRALAALDLNTVEDIQPDGRSSCNSRFDYLFVYKHVVEELSTENVKSLGFYLDIGRIEPENQGATFRACEILQQYVEKSAPQDDLHGKLATSLGKIYRNDIAQKLRRL